MNLEVLKNAALALTPWPEQQSISIVRGDQIHPVVSGNKLFKLLPVLERLHNPATSGVISVGGRYSNHLHALAYSSWLRGKPSVGLVRGYAAQPLTSTLEDCQRWGMSFHFLNKIDYQQRYASSFWQYWLARYPDYFPVKEGGWSPEAISASAMWWSSIPKNTQLVVCAVGSGSTLAGLAKTAPVGTDVIGVPAFNDPHNYQELRQKLAMVGVHETQYDLWIDPGNRGFGKLTSEQQRFKQEFEKQSGIELDNVYNTKSFFALQQMLQHEPALQNLNIAIIHSGGVQGNRS